MDTCQFTYIRRRDGQKVTTLGVEQAWEVLCAEFNRDGPGLIDGIHYRTISVDGPELFAVYGNGLAVYYHDCGVWHKYITAYDIIYDVLPDTGTGCLSRATIKTT